MMKRLLAVCLAAGVLAGCASSGRLGPLPEIEPGRPVSRLVVYRISSLIGVTNSYYLLLDGREIFSLRSGEHTGFMIESGEHVLGVKCFGGVSPTWKENFVMRLFSPESEHFFEISPDLNCARIIAVPADEGKKSISSSTFIDPQKASD
jgi:hypothetical protein